MNLPDEYDISINVTYHGAAVQILDRSTDEIIYEQNDLDDVDAAIDYVVRTIREDPTG
ncbi:hypothetical protein MSAS_23820 [Mycobacterium saskatchewanense]|uniref:hypothetical protein n=1 Tax=Mycobacterium saskatchewanense TaxID=220927 RepID=UPI001302428C|nr:hypothetical protein [Mycobacterium saskatchewanense]BBX63208.1 hypothetical protein MSAS_23820 [Mycobacterium saskatchewanense]